MKLTGKKCLRLQATLIALLLPALVYSQSIWTAGPMLHVNFGAGKATFSWAIEVAYWNFDGFPYSVDAAMEFDKRKTRIYSELQTGVGLAGISAGPVLEFQKEESKLKLGWQGSVWGNYFLGFDIRARFIDSKTFFCPGMYVKGAFMGRDENGEKVESSSFDWDD
jgi:hypothetical protein